LRPNNTNTKCICVTGTNAYNNVDVVVVAVVVGDDDNNNYSHYSGNLSRYLKIGIKQVKSNYNSHFTNKT
jgi:hypothetical protein